MALLQQVIEFLAPVQCLNCGRPGDLVCPACLPSLAITKVPTCWRCNRLSPGGPATAGRPASRQAGATCSSCRASSKLAGVVVASHYDGAVKALVKAIKYQNAISASRIAAGLIIQTLEPDRSGQIPDTGGHILPPPLPRLRPVGDFDIVTSVPSAAKAYRQRGYNQAELIAKVVASQLGLPYRPLLGRLPANRQVGQNRQARLEQVRGRFYPLSPVANARILIIDDVLTTGATLNECATVLKSAGGQRVWGAVVAKH